MSGLEDISDTIIAKSDQLNALDLVGGEKRLIITKVERTNDESRPIWIYYQGGDGRPWKASKGMRSILIQAWGKDGRAYVGRHVNVYCAPEVLYAGVKAGGVRICGLSHIAKDTTYMVREGRNRLVPYLAKRIEIEGAPPADKVAAAEVAVNSIISEIEASSNYFDVLKKHEKSIARIKTAYPDLYAKISAVVSDRESALDDDSDDEVAL